MSELSIRTPGSCRCAPVPDGEPRGVLVRIDGEPGETEYGVSITCAACGRIVWIEEDAELVGDEIPMVLTCARDAAGRISYELAEAPA